MTTRIRRTSPPAGPAADGAHGSVRLHVVGGVQAGVVHAGIGKASFDETKIVENAAAFIDAVRKARPSGAKGTYIRKITLSSTMGAGVAVEDVA